jgi:hypothetical protein
MKNIAETTARGVKEIFDEVSLENPEVAAKISFSRMETVMTKRRRALRPKNPEDLNDIVRTLVNSQVYGCQLQETIVKESEDGKKREGALIFSSEKSLAAANCESIKVLQLDATFSPIPAKEHRLHLAAQFKAVIFTLGRPFYAKRQGLD